MAHTRQGIDLIGDVHGCAKSLELLLQKLGYSKQSGVYRHPSRRVIFLGDIVDRGPRIREALHLVYDMVTRGDAEIVMGNHEYNVLCYLTPGEAGSGMEWLRERTPRHFRILKETLEQLANHPQDQKDFLDWFMTMPIYLESDHYRVVHACWQQDLIDQFQAEYGGNRFSERLLHRSADSANFEWSLMDRLLRGTHLRLPNGEQMVSKDGFKRSFFRTKFWARNPQNYIDVVFQPDPLPEHVARLPLTRSNHDDLSYYSEHEPLLFIGHYWREGDPQPITSNIACLDYSAVKYGKLVAYRLDDETEIRPDKFVWVDVKREVNE